MVALQLLNKVIQVSSINLIQQNDLTIDFFPEYENEYNFILKHYEEYGNVPDKETFLNAFPNFEFITVTESDKYLIDTIYEEHTYSQMVEIIQTSAELMKTNSNDAVEYLKAKMSNINISLNRTYVDIISQSNLRYDEFIKSNYLSVQGA